MKEYFQLKEFMCQCGCQRTEMHQTHIDRLNHARDLAGIPFKINSGYRCPDHNRAIGSKDTSSHVKGCASDIAARGSRDRFLIIGALIVAGFNRIGIAKTFIHADSDPDKGPDVIWLY